MSVNRAYGLARVAEGFMERNNERAFNFPRPQFFFLKKPSAIQATY